MSSNANALRAQALALLEEASRIDKLRPYTVSHSHKYGTCGYVGWFAEQPSEEDLIEEFNIDFEPEKNEYLSIDSITLTELLPVNGAKEQSEADVILAVDALLTKAGLSTYSSLANVDIEEVDATNARRERQAP